MLISNPDRSDIISNGVKNEVTATVAVNGKTFRVLADTLYQNKIGSICRELSCNALDSHIQAGKADVPFRIHLPTMFEPHFSVQDFGVGMSHDTVCNVFMRFFESTKDASNNQVGAFGLGGKTPFSYTDSFTMVSVHDGITRSYAMMCGPDGMPVASLMYEAPTDACSGVTISMAVQNRDIDTFRHEVHQQLRFMAVKPEFENCTDFKWINPLDRPHTFVGDVAVFSDHEYNAPIWIIQGGVGYPLDIKEIKKQTFIKYDEKLLDLFKHGGAAMFFNIGEIRVTPSREGISYDEYTLTAIIGKLNTVAANLATTVQADLDALSDNWQRALKINSLGSTFAMTESNLDLAKYNANWTIDTAHNAVYDPMFWSETVSFTDKDGNPAQREAKRKHSYSTQFTHRTRGGNRVVRASSNLYNYKDILTPKTGNHDKLFILINDAPEKPHKRIENYMLNSPSNGEVVVVIASTNEKLLTVAEVEAYYEGGARVALLSSLPVPPRAARSSANRSGYKLPQYYSIGGHNVSTEFKHWSPEYEKVSELTDNLFYVIVDNRNIKFQMNYNHLQFPLFNSEVSGNIIAIRERDVEKAKDNPNLINLEDYLSERYIELQAKFTSKMNQMAYNVALKNCYITESIGRFTRLFTEDQRKVFHKLNRVAKREADGFKIDVNAMRFFANADGTSDQFSAKVRKYRELLNAIHKDFQKSFPLLQFARSSYPDDQDEDFKLYVGAVVQKLLTSA